MGRRAKPPKGKPEAKRTPVAKSPRNESSRVGDLEKRLADARERLQTSDRERAEAHAQQAATAEILRVMSSSPTNAQPVFEAIAESAALLTDAVFGGTLLVADEMLHLAAIHIPAGGPNDAFVRSYPVPLDENTLGTRVARERIVVNISDTDSEPSLPESQRERARTLGARSLLVVPMVRGTHAVGMIIAARRQAIAFTDKQVALLQTFADQAVIAIENVRLFKELEARNRDLMATSEVLQVISRSPTDVQPAFDTIAERAARLCDGLFSGVYRFDGKLIHLAGHNNWPAKVVDLFRRFYPAPPSRETQVTEAILDARVVEVRDYENDPTVSPQSLTRARALGYRSILVVPMLREGSPVGAIAVARAPAGAFSEQHVDLLRTFADQAVIAIENVRLFTELQEKNRALTAAHTQVTETLQQQTATSDILRVISSSPTNVQPVFDAIVSSAVRLLHGYFGAMTRVVGDRLERVAVTSAEVELKRAAAEPRTSGIGDSVRAGWPQPLHGESVYAKAIRDGAPVNIADALTEPGVSDALRAIAHAIGYRSLVAVPLLRHDEAIGAIAVIRREAGGFTDDEITLLKTFADQAVIAIENVRLFRELQGRNADLTEALEQQTATSDILRVISSSPTELQPVFDTIIQNAVRLLGGFSGVVTRLVGGQLHLGALTSTNPAGDAAQKALWPKPLMEDRSLHGQVIAALEPRFIADCESDPSVPPEEVAVARARGYRSVVAVPLVREAVAVGSMTVTRRAPGPFSDSEIKLLGTFADQAVIAIENVRLFMELEARTGELTRSVGELQALGEVGQAVSSSLDLPTVLATIVSRSVGLSGAAGGAIYEYDEAGEEFHLRATDGLPNDYVQIGRQGRRGEGATGRLAFTHAPVEVPDIAAPGAYESRTREVLIRHGHRSLLAVPLLREDRILGSLVVFRKTAGQFGPEVVALLQTFATQSAVAIQNARLFREIADKSRQVEAASRHKSEFLANVSHELRTPLNAIIGYSELLEEEAGDLDGGRLVPDLQKIATAAKHQLSLINDILDLSKIEAGRMELEPTDFDLLSAIDNALTLVRERATRRGITLEQATDDRVGLIRGDERKVKQVLLNLLSNALKFTPEGGRIDVRARVQDEVAEVSVTDTGVGIAPEDQEAVFEEFRQVGTADKKVEGTGLGLALARKFIELHGGRIWVQSQKGHGSTFTFTIPVRREPATEEASLQ